MAEAATGKEVGGRPAAGTGAPGSVPPKHRCSERDWGPPGALGCTRLLDIAGNAAVNTRVQVFASTFSFLWGAVEGTKPPDL